MEKNEQKQRDSYIDTIKGLCVISIIFIHTVFCSGEKYVPDIVRTIALFFDVPVFFFLTGCLMSVHKNINPIKQMLKLIVLFGGIFLFFQLILGERSITMFNPIFLNVGNIPLLSVLNASYWFVPVYITCLIYSIMIIKYLKRFFILSVLILIPIFYLIAWFTNHQIDLTILGTPLQRTLFYLWVMLLGYVTYKNKYSKLYGIAFILLSIFSLTLLKFNNVDLYIQRYKFPVVQLPYFLASLLSVGLTLVCIRTFKDNIFSNIGQKAIYFYASQGIGSSIIYLVRNFLSCNIYVKLVICFVTNITLSLLIGLIIYKIFHKFGNIICSQDTKLF